VQHFNNIATDVTSIDLFLYCHLFALLSLAALILTVFYSVVKARDYQPHPLYPSPLIREGEEIKKRGFAPLKLP